MLPPDDAIRARTSLHWAVPLAVVLAALVPRVPRALASYHPSNDAAEYVLLARSLAEGRGFELPIRVRFFEDGDQDVHSAFRERAPIFPLILSTATRPVVGWPAARLQLMNVMLGALAALLTCLLAADLARLRGLRGRSLGWVALLAGLTAAWLPSGVRASVHLWAEPLGLVMVLGSLRHWLGLGSVGTGDPTLRLGRLVALGLLAGVARFARPELWVLVPVFLALELGAGRRRNAAVLLGVFGAVNVAGVAWTGVLAPQLDLLSVRTYEDFMRPGAAAVPTWGEMLGGGLANLRDQVLFMLTPRRAFLVLPLAVAGAGQRTARPFLALALALVLATALVWSTSDPSRFTLAPLCLLAPVAALEAELWRKRLLPGSSWALAGMLAVWLGVLGFATAKEAKKRSTLPDQRAVIERPGQDPWSYALVTGLPARLEGPPR